MEDKPIIDRIKERILQLPGAEERLPVIFYDGGIDLLLECAYLIGQTDTLKQLTQDVLEETNSLRLANPSGAVSADKKDLNLSDN